MFKIGDRVKLIGFISSDYWDGRGTIKEIDGQKRLDMCLIAWDEPVHNETDSFEYIEDIEHVIDGNDVLKGML